MRLALAGASLALIAAAPQVGYFRYQRTILNVPQPTGQTCAALDANVFTHSAARLADLRVYREGGERDGEETPFAMHVATAIEGAEKSIAPLNLGRRTGQTAFDAAMPEGVYSNVQLTIAAHDFIATVTVSGSQEQAGAETKLGSYTIFDLTRQKLGRSTVLHLPDSDLRYLHFRIAGPIQPENVGALTIGRMPAGQPKYVTIAETAHATQNGHSTVFEFTLPSGVPVDRIVFTPAAQPGNFSRDVSVLATPILSTPPPDGGEPVSSNVAAGTLLRVHTVQDGRHIEEEHLELDAPGTQFEAAEKLKIAIDNGDDKPLELKSVRLEMLERSLCFDAAAGAAYALYYGDPALATPRYDYARLFAYQPNALRSSFGPEQSNAAYRPRPDQRPFTERHPVLLWIALIAVIALLAFIALRSAKSMQQAP